MKFTFKVTLSREKNSLPLVKDVLSKGGFVKPGPDKYSAALSKWAPLLVKLRFLKS